MRRQLACALIVTSMFGADLTATTAQAAPVRFSLEPATVQLSFRAYGLGLMAIDGGFTSFHGTLTLDDANPAACAISIEAATASLKMPSQGMTDDAQGPDLLDVTHFPDFRVDGKCVGGQLQATLLLHGVSKPVVLDVNMAPGSWHASGMIRRAEWGMGARAWLAGPEVRISMTAGLPPGFRPGL